MSWNGKRAELASFSRALARTLGWKAVVTSFFRPDRTAHRRGDALDIAFRSGPLADQRNAHDVNYFLTPGLLGYVTMAVRVLEGSYPTIKRVLIEHDHLHIERSSRNRPRRPGEGIDVLVYGVPKVTSFVRHGGLNPPLRVVSRG